MIFKRRAPFEVLSDQMDTIQALAKRENGTEIGGLLLGHWNDSNVVIERIIEITDPGATYSSWSRDQDRAQTMLDRTIAEDSSTTLGYVGDWHTHPEMIKASFTDISSLKRDSRQYKRPIVLVVRLPDGSLDIHMAHQGRKIPVNYINTKGK